VRNWFSTLVLLLMLTVTGMLVAVMLTQPDLESLPEFTPGVTEVIREDSGMRVTTGTPDIPSMPPTRETFEGRPEQPNSTRSMSVTRHTRKGVFRERLISATVGRRFRADRVGVMMELNATSDSLPVAVRDLAERRDGLRRALAKAGHRNPGMIDGEVTTSGTEGRDGRAGRHTARMKLLLILDGSTDVSELLARPEFEQMGRVTRVSYALSDPAPAIDEMRREAIDAARAQIADQGLAGWSEAGLNLHYPANGLQLWHASPMIMIRAEATVTLRAAN
jgi:hypothetical protein